MESVISFNWGISSLMPIVFYFATYKDDRGTEKSDLPRVMPLDLALLDSVISSLAISHSYFSNNYKTQENSQDNRCRKFIMTP